MIGIFLPFENQPKGGLGCTHALQAIGTCSLDPFDKVQGLSTGALGDVFRMGVTVFGSATGWFAT